MYEPDLWEDILAKGKMQTLYKSNLMRSLQRFYHLSFKIFIHAPNHLNNPSNNTIIMPQAKPKFQLL